MTVAASSVDSAAGGQTPGAAGRQPPAAAGLQGTAWRLVKFQGGDGTTLTPPDPARYTIQFEPKGRLAARIDCNRGSGTWTSKAPGQLELGPMALTRALCPPGSLHDQIVKQWAAIRSYVIRDGHLFLSLTADGGIYEFEPLPKADAAKPPPQAARFQCGTNDVAAAVKGDVLTLTLEGRTHTLTRVRAASGAKYESDGEPTMIFWDKGSSATLSLGAKEYPPCTKR